MGVVIALSYNAYSIGSSVQQGLSYERDLIFQGVRGQLAQLRDSEVVYAGVVQGALIQLQSHIGQRGSIFLNSAKSVRITNDVKTPSLEVDGLELANNFEAVDLIKEKFGSSATIFVRSGSDFVRVSTNVIKDDGSRAVGTKLAPDGPAYAALIKGESFFGQTQILNKPYYTGYVPIFSKDKEIIGAWYAGYLLKSLISTLEFVEKARILEKGFVTLYKSDQGKMNLLVKNDQEILKDAAFANWLESDSDRQKSLGDWNFMKSVEPGGYVLVSAIYEPDVLARVVAATISGTGILVLVIMTLLIGVIIFARRLERTLSQVVIEADSVGGTVTTTAGQMTSTGRQLSDGAVQAAASIEETVASLEELVSMVSRNAENSKAANTLTGQTRDLTVQGGSQIQSLLKAMSEIQASSKKVSEIVTVMDDIAFQTNLLALNASVEAARAGEHGRGFAVVADAVRSLALKSAESARDISKLIQESVERTTDGTKLVDTSVASFDEITGAIEKLTFIVSEIATASEEQSIGMKQISLSMNQLDQVTQTNATAAEKSANASQDLSSNAEELSGIVTELKVLIRGVVA